MDSKCSSSDNCQSGSLRKIVHQTGDILALADIPIATTSLKLKDTFGGWKVRWGIGRSNYTVEPGLYVVGKPDASSPILVSANYKLTFDLLRKSLAGIDCWLLILDTKGVNVWCAAGKGTFGTDELVHQIKAAGLAKVVTHRKLILPQLAAPGISAHRVARDVGFSVTYGPVRASDIKEFIAVGNQATKEMRAVNFTFWDRLVLAPMELAIAAKVALSVFGVLFLINLFAQRPFGIEDFLVYIASILIGAVIAPALLPVIPGRAFAFKGWLLGAIGTASIVWIFGWFNSPYLLLGIGYMLVLPAHAAFLTMNFTGASTYTSPSGVLREMRIALPPIILATVLGIILLLVKAFTG